MFSTSVDDLLHRKVHIRARGCKLKALIFLINICRLGHLCFLIGLQGRCDFDHMVYLSLSICSSRVEIRTKHNLPVTMPTHSRLWESNEYHFQHRIQDRRRLSCFIALLTLISREKTTKFAPELNRFAASSCQICWYIAQTQMLHYFSRYFVR